MDYSKLSITEIMIFEKFATADYVPNVKCQNEVHRQACLEYQRLANAMPYVQMRDALKKYDESSPKMDEIKFVRDLQNEFNQTEEDVLKRIRHVRQFTKIQEKLKQSES
jgi:hypothetical protein